MLINFNQVVEILQRREFTQAKMAELIIEAEEAAHKTKLELTLLTKERAEAREEFNAEAARCDEARTTLRRKCWHSFKAETHCLICGVHISMVTNLNPAERATDAY